MTRRPTRLRPALTPLTPAIPEPRPDIGLISHAQLKSELCSVRRLLAVERQRNAKIERVLVHQLDELQCRVDSLRSLYMQTLTPQIVPADRKAR